MTWYLYIITFITTLCNYPSFCSTYIFLGFQVPVFCKHASLTNSASKKIKNPLKIIMGVRGRCSFQQTGHFLGVSNWQPKPSFFSTRRWHLRSFRSGNTDLPYTLKEPMRFGQDHDGELGNFDESFLFFAGGFSVYCFFWPKKRFLAVVFSWFTMKNGESMWIVETLLVCFSRF